MISAIDHNAAALARLAQYLKGKPRFAALLASATRGHDQLEAAIRQVLDDTTLDAALGVQLDQIGDLVGLGRQGIISDATYRVMLKAQIKVNRSSGTIADLVAIFKLVAAGGTTVTEVEEPPAGFVVRLLDVAQDPDLIPFFARFLRDARAAGVRGLLEWAESPTGDMFRFDSGPGLDQGHLAGAID